MKANKKTLIAVKSFLQNEEGWNWDEIISDIISETDMLKYGDSHIFSDECTIVWGVKSEGDDICNLQEFVDEYTKIFIKKMCKILDSFVGDDNDCYFKNEE